MATLLITGARAPAAWEIATNMNQHGHHVYLADSLYHAIGKLCPSVAKYLLIPSPKADLKQYALSLVALLQDYHIDYLLPTCEEVFYIATIKKELAEYAEILCPDLDLLLQLHNKKTVLEFTWDDHVRPPATYFLDDLPETRAFDTSDYVLKKEYCRFGTEVKLRPTLDDLGRAQAGDQPHNRYLLQQKIRGEEICCYAIMAQGQVNLCACYLPKYRIAESASIFFEACHVPEITAYLQVFASKTNFTGQISFDLIKNEEGIFLIECNPRATSGVHLCCDADLARLLIGEETTTWLPNRVEPAQIKLAMGIFAGPRYLLSPRLWEFIKDYHRGRDVLSGRSRYSLLKQQILSLLELSRMAIQNNQSLLAASTADIAWNGCEDHVDGN